MRSMIRIYVRENGNIYTHMDRYGIHNTNGPSVLWSDGARFWYVMGKKHRMEGPAVVLSDGSTERYIGGVWYDGEVQHEAPE